MRRPELLAPGGSFHAAYHAIEAGADGIYLGLREFSARRAAANFDLGQLARIRGFAGERGRRIYVALNTVVRDAEIGRLAETLARLEALAVDGVIVQDLGVAALARTHFPSLPLHASTQMAVHSAAGLSELAGLGFRRVILSRELTLPEIAALRAARSDLELEVFVHGALCYSFSGVCLASWALTGRSGNRGDCAQICRGRFTVSAGANAEGAAGAFFSCRDLFLGREALELVQLGVDGFKIEGRMKSPEYTAAVVRLYRAVIDEGATLSPEMYDRLVRDAQATFAREPTSGWLRSSSGSRLVDSRFPGHRGASLGAVATVRRAPRSARWAELTLQADLSLRDGLAFMSVDGTEQTAFSVQGIRRKGRDVRFARAGETVEVRLPDGAALPGRGQEMRQLSSRFLDLPEPKEASVPPYRMPIPVRIEISGRAGGEAALALAAPDLEGARVEERVSLEEARNPRPFLDILSGLLAESGASDFIAARMTLSNATGLADDRIFVPPSQLKSAKNRFYARLDEAFRSSAAARSALIARGPPAAPRPDAAALGPAELAAFADRTATSPHGREPLPFAWLEADGSIDPANLATRSGFVVVPLSPVMFDTGPWARALDLLARGMPGAMFAVGLANLAHLAVARGLAALPNVRFFADFHLYTANRWTAAFLAANVPGLLFSYRWIEEAPGPAGWEDAAAVPVVPIAPGFRAPLFVSRGCFAKHVLHGGTCPSGCPRDFRVDLRQGGRLFEAVVTDCVTYLFA